MSSTAAARQTASEADHSLPEAVRAAWRSARRSGLIAPELPSILFVAVASCTGFWWGLGIGALAVVAVLGARLRRALPTRTVVGGAVGLAIAASIAYRTGVAASGVLSDVCIDLGLAAVLAGSIVVRRPLFGVLWSLVRREPLPFRASRSARRAYNLMTGIAAVALAIRSLALAVVYVRDEQIAWLLAVKIVLGLPVTLVVIAAAYAAAGVHDDDSQAEQTTGQTTEQTTYGKGVSA